MYSTESFYTVKATEMFVLDLSHNETVTIGCAVLFVCLTLLASFFLPSHLSLKHVHVCYICMCIPCELSQPFPVENNRVSGRNLTPHGLAYPIL